jgi:precorrin-6B methylase 2
MNRNKILLKKIILALALFIVSPAWSVTPTGSCGDLAISKLGLNPELIKNLGDPNFRPTNEDLELTPIQERNFRIQILKALNEGDFSQLSDSKVSERLMFYLLRRLPTDLKFSLEIRDNLGPRKWLRLLSSLLTQEYFYMYDAIYTDRILFALPNREIEALGRARGNDLPRRPRNHNAQVEVGSWLTLDTEAYNTSYNDFRVLIKSLRLPASSVLVDMGSGLGRMGMVVGSFFPKLNYVGYEYHDFRMKPAEETARAFGFDNVQYIQADFTSKNLDLTDGDVFFFYFPNNTDAVMKAAIEKIRKVAEKKKILVVSRMMIGGGASEYQMHWLKEIKRLDHGIRVFQSQ